eukprot:TRINITY_DN1984_c0_g1_i4.p1 TRINITY_DN1984_c0_g1~~TRINITY_DN1984_c0_g1_i4.p1  ORF type:complete len:282 (+),score=81.12 TRINITY_DN1984_c0_g1_i4:53-898(+)
MAVLVVLLLASAFVGAVRVANDESEDRCARLEGEYVDARNKMDASAKRGGDAKDSKNMIRLLGAARSLKKALYAECDWAKNLPKDSHEDSAPSLNEQMHSKLAKRPCGDQVLALLNAGELGKAIDAYMAKEGKCPAMPQTTQTDGNPDVAEPEVPPVPDAQDEVNDDAIADGNPDVAEPEVPPVPDVQDEVDDDAMDDIDDAMLAKEVDDDAMDDVDDAMLAKKTNGSGASSALLEETMSDHLALDRVSAIVVVVVLFIFFPHLLVPSLVVIAILYLMGKI